MIEVEMLLVTHNYLLDAAKVFVGQVVIVLMQAADGAIVGTHSAGEGCFAAA